MKKYIVRLFLFLGFLPGIAQNTTVTANSFDVSDNLDLQAVASIFGDSKNLEDFEFRLNDPKARISNLDLNDDGYVDYLRVVELVDSNTHLVVLQAVLGTDMYQDVATIEVEKTKKRGEINIQVVGNSFLYGPNYIYEPVYVSRPPMFSLWWSNSYVPYSSSWYWGYYPSYFYNYNPFATNIYIGHIHNQINFNNNYFYHPYRYSSRAQRLYYRNRHDYYERLYPSRDFRNRYKDYNYVNRYDRNNGKFSNGLTYDRGSSNSNFSNSSYNRPSSNKYTNTSSSSGTYMPRRNTNVVSRPGSSNSSYNRPSSSNSSYNRPSSSNSSYNRPSSSNSSYNRPSSSNSSYSRPSSSTSSYSRPSSSNSSYSRPSSSNSSYSRPSSSNSSYSRPSSSNSSYSRPSSSNSSYSRPSSSNSSYSRPSSSNSSYSRSSSSSSSSNGYSR